MCLFEKSCLLEEKHDRKPVVTKAGHRLTRMYMCRCIRPAFWSAKNPEKRIQKNEKAKQYQRLRMAKNPEEVKQYQRQYKQKVRACKEKALEKQRLSRETNPEKYDAYLERNRECMEGKESREGEAD